MQVGTIRQDLAIDTLLVELHSNLAENEHMLYLCLVNDRQFKYLAITNIRFIFIDEEELKITRYMSHQHVTKLRFTMGMWHIETKAQPLAYFGFAHKDRIPVLKIFQELKLPIKD